LTSPRVIQSATWLTARVGLSASCPVSAYISGYGYQGLYCLQSRSACQVKVCTVHQRIVHSADAYQCNNNNSTLCRSGPRCDWQPVTCSHKMFTLFSNSSCTAPLTAAIAIAQVWKPPYSAQPDSVTNTWKQEVELASPSPTTLDNALVQLQRAANCVHRHHCNDQ